MSKNRRKLNWSAIKEKMEETTSKKGKQNSVDPRFFTPTPDDEGKYEAKIRFVPGPESSEIILPVVQFFKHIYKNPKNGKVFYEKCPSTPGINQKCPACEEYFNNWENNKFITARMNT